MTRGFHYQLFWNWPPAALELEERKEERFGLCVNVVIEWAKRKDAEAELENERDKRKDAEAELQNEREVRHRLIAAGVHKHLTALSLTHPFGNGGS